MKRFFGEDGVPANDPALSKAEGLIHEAYDAFKEAGYLNRDFFQLVDLEASLKMYDDELEKALGEA